MNKSFKIIFSILTFAFFISLAMGSSDSNENSNSTDNENSIENTDTPEEEETTSIEEQSNESETSNNEDYYSNTKCNNCGMGKYNSNGICDMCSAASPSRVEESYSDQYESCMGCNATGWRGDEVCPICEGKGKYMPY
jgi:DnaJ-class molecular chaperone